MHEAPREVNDGGRSSWIQSLPPLYFSSEELGTVVSRAAFPSLFEADCPSGCDRTPYRRVWVELPCAMARI